LHGLLRGLEENERHPIAYRNPNEFSRGLTLAELRSFPYNLIELFDYFSLLVNQQL
jgi:hypothetical protein